MGLASGYDPASGKDPLSDPDICLRGRVPSARAYEVSCC